MNKVSKFVIDVLQWLLIATLFFICIKLTLDNKTRTEKFKMEQTETTYKLVYYGQNLRELKKENESLYHMVDSLNNVKSAIEVKYVYKYQTDTIYVPMMEVNEKDSIYTYKFDNDTIAFKMDAKAKDLEWMKGEFSVNDSFRIVTMEEYGQYTTIIEHGPNVDITETTAWQQKPKWYEHIHYGPGVTAGWDVVNKKFGVMAGATVLIQF